MARALTLDLKLNLADLNARVSEAGRKLQGLASTSMQNLRGALQPAIQGLRGLKDTAQEAGLALGALSAAGALGLRKIVQGAADDERSLRRLRSTFGDLAEGAEQFADQLARVSRRQAGELQSVLVTLQNILVPLDVGRERAAAMSQELTSLAVDLSAEFGVSVEDAGQRIAAAMFGAGKALRDFGINLKQENIEEEARRMGLAFKSLGDLTEEQRALATLNVILRDSAKFQGAAAREAETFSGQMRVLGDSFDELASDLGKNVIQLLKPLLSALNDAVAGLRGFIAGFPKLTGVLAVAGAGATALFTGLTALGFVVSSLGPSFLSAVSLIGNIADISLTATRNFAAWSTGIRTATQALYAMSGAALAVGAAFLGWQIGRKIDEAAGLGDAFEKAILGKAKTSADKFKAALVAVGAVLTRGPLGSLEIADQMATVEKANLDLAASTERIVSSFEAGSEQLANYNRFLKEGIPAYQAAKLAQDELQELFFLEAKGAKLSAEQQERLEQLRRRNADRLREHTAAQEQNKSSAQRLQEAKKSLLDTEKDFSTKLAEISEKNVRLRQGEHVSSIAALNKTAAEERRILEERAEKHLQITRDLEARKRQILEAGASSPQLKTELAEIDRELQAHAGKVAAIHQGLLQSQQNYTDELAAIQDNRLKELRENAASEVETVRRSTEEQVRLYDVALSKIDQQLEDIRNRQARGKADAEAFIRQFERDDLRKKDARAAELVDLAEQTRDALRASQTEEQRVRIQEIFARRSGEIVASKARELELTQQIQELEQRAGRLSAEGNRTEALRVTQELLSKERDLAAERKSQADAATRVEALKVGLALESQQAAEQNKVDTESITELEARRLEVQTKITQQKALELESITKINSGLKDQETALLRLVETQRQYAQALAQSQPALQQNPASGAAGATNIADAKSAATAAQQAAVQANGAAQQLAVSTKFISEAFTLSLAPLREQFTGLQGFVQQIGQQAAQLVPAISESLAQVLEGQNLVRQSLDQFGNVIIEKFGDTANGFRAQKILIDGLSEQIRQIDIRGASGAGDLGAAGLL